MFGYFKRDACSRELMININLLIAYIRHLIKNMTVSINLNMPSNATIEDLLDVILVYNVTYVYDTGSLPEGT